MRDSSKAPSGDWLRLDELSNAVDNLEMCAHFIATLPHPIRWKWAIVALHQAVYGFAICAVKGTDDTSVLQPGKRSKQPKLISIWQALKRANDKRFLWPDSAPIQLASPERKALGRLFLDFRNGFEHFQPAGWSIEVSGMPSLFRAALGPLKRLALEQGSVRYYSQADRDRVSAGIARLEGLVGRGSAA